VDTQTRHALKQDRLVEATRTSVDWFQDHRSRVIQAALAAAILIALVVAALVIYNQRSAAADLAFGEAMDTYSAPLAQPGQPPTPGEKTFPTAAARAKLANQQFAQIADKYSLVEAGKTARYFAGLTAIDLGQTGQAETYLKQVADGHDAALASLAKLALANLYQQLNRNSEAVVLYNQLIAKPTTTVPADAARLQLAALYEKTNPAEANKIYAQLKTSKTAAGQIAAQKLQQK
jgi:tetratricopeptide (TPR) repeat protein